MNKEGRCEGENGNRVADSGDAALLPRFHNTLIHFTKYFGMSPRDDDVLISNDRGRQSYSAFEPIDHW